MQPGWRSEHCSAGWLLTAGGTFQPLVVIPGSACEPPSPPVSSTDYNIAENHPKLEIDRSCPSVPSEKNSNLSLRVFSCFDSMNVFLSRPNLALLAGEWKIFSGKTKVKHMADIVVLAIYGQYRLM